MIVKLMPVILMAALVTSCAIIQQNPDNKPVRLIFYNEINIVGESDLDCRYLGSIVSSDGHWYNYLFISNSNLTLGSINDMHNKANEIGANVIYINDNIDFATSVTLLGQAYACDKE